jgi:hypothetical protein
MLHTDSCRGKENQDGETRQLEAGRGHGLTLLSDYESPIVLRDRGATVSGLEARVAPARRPALQQQRSPSTVVQMPWRVKSSQ